MISAQPTLLFLPPRESKARRLAFLFMAFAPLLAGLLSLALGQDSNWDLRNYHWYNAYAFLNDRYAMDHLPSQTPSFYNPLMDVPFFLLAQAASAKTVAFIMGAVQGINMILLFMLAHASLIIANPRQKVLACAGLSLLGFIGGGGLAMLGTTFYDNVTSLGLFLSALLVLRLMPRLVVAPIPSMLALAALCGFPAGLMMGFKLPFVVFCVGLCGAFLFIRAPLLRRIGISFGFGLGILAGLALTFGAWGHFLNETYGSPLFPYFNDIFKSPLGPDNSGRDVQFIPGRWHDILFFPFIFTAEPHRVGEIPWRDLRILILYVLLPVALVARLLFGRNRKAPDRLAEPDNLRYLLGMASLSYAVWIVMFAIYRYLIPLEMLAPLLIVFAASLLPARPHTRKLLVIFLLTLIALTIEGGTWGRKTPWLSKAVEVTIPPIDLSQKPMILMAGFEPYSHVVPAFPPEIPFVRIQSNFASPDQDKGINKIAHEKVKAHKGTYKLLIPDYDFNRAQEALSFFKLEARLKSCTKVEDHLYETKLVLCDIQPLGKP